MSPWPAAGLDALRVGDHHPVAAPLAHGILNGLTRGLWRVGSGGDSYVLKVVAPPERTDANAVCFDPAHPAWWQREPLAYASGALAELPGIVAPRCVAITDAPDGSVGMLLEALEDCVGPDWPLERYALAARHFGELNGAFASGASLPDAEWVHPGCLHAIAATYPSELEVITRRDAWDVPAVKALVGANARERVLAFAEASPRVVAALESLHLTFCHFDSSRPNLFALLDGRTGVVDWSVCGLGPVGEEMVAFVWGTANQFRVPITEFGDLERAGLDGYLDGLARAACRVSEDEVRFAYAAASCVHWLLDGTAMLLGIAAQDGSRDWILRVLPRPIEEHLELRAAVLDHMLRLWDKVSRAIA